MHLSYVKYREGLEHAFSELYMGKDCYGNRCATARLPLGLRPTSSDIGARSSESWVASVLCLKTLCAVALVYQVLFQTV